MARLELLGPPRWVDDRGVRPLQPTRAAFLIVRLVSAAGWTPRDALLPLLWHDADEGQARTSLRQLLRSLPTDLAVAVEREGNALRYVGPCDLTDAALLELGGDWSAALALHRGPFLAGFAPRRAPAFEGWADEERGRWERTFQTIARRAFGAAVAAAAVEVAVDAGRRWVERDPLDADVVAAVAEGLRGLGAAVEADRVVDRHASAAADLGLPLDVGVLAARGSNAGGANDPATRTRTRPLRSGRVPPGRAGDLAALHAWWAGPGRWLTVVAPGGMGKTTLMRAWADSVHASGVDLDHVDLNGVTDGDEATRRAVAALARGSRAPRTGVAAFGALVADRRHVLVLDAAEDVADAAATLAAWTSAAPGLRLAVTSRRPLGGSGERVQHLAALPVVRPADGGGSVAAEVAWARARAAAGANEAGIHPPDVVQHAVERIGGWPLGLELLAGWAAWLGLDGWLATLERDDLDLDTGDAVRTIAASWRHLDEARRDAIGALAAVPRPWTLDEARAVGVAAGQVADLAAMGWVSAGEAVFTIHPLLVAHARSERPRRFDDARAAHARHVLATYVAAYERTGRPPPEAWRRLHHLLAAWDWACGAADVDALARALPVVANTLVDDRRLDDVLWCVARVRDLLAATAPQKRATDATGQLARALDATELRALYDIDRARGRALADRLHAAAAAAGDPTAVAQATAFKAVVAFADDADWVEAERLAHVGLAVLDGASDRASLGVGAQLANLIGLIAGWQQRPDDARHWIERAERLAFAAGGASAAAGWGHNLAHLDLVYGNVHRALARNAAGLEAAERDGAPIHLTERWHQRAVVALALGDAPGARTSAGRLLAACAGMHPDARDGWRRSGWRFMAEAALLEGDADAAARWLGSCGHDLEAERARVERALAVGDANAALDHARTALAIVATRGDGDRDPVSVARLRALEATALVLGDAAEAGSAVVEAIDAALALPFAPLHARAARPALAWALAAGHRALAAHLAAVIERAPFCDGATRRAVRALTAAADVRGASALDPPRSPPASEPRTELDELLRTCADLARVDAMVRDPATPPSARTTAAD